MFKEKWKNQVMVTAGQKAQITKLKQAGKIEEAKKYEAKLAEIVSQDLAEQVKTVKPLKQVNVKSTIPYKPKALDGSLAWVEKHRPASLVGMIGSVAPYLRAFLQSNSFPLGLLFFGDYGEGKTLGAKCFVRDYFALQGVITPEATFSDLKNCTGWTKEYEGCWSPVLLVDSAFASFEAISDKIRDFMQVKAMWNPKNAKLKKFVIVDEADRVSYQNQGKLRCLMEKYPNTVTIYTTNKIGGIDPAIVSRCSGGVFEFKKPDVSELVAYLKRVLKVEGKRLGADVVEEIAVACGSVREAVGKLQQEVVVRDVR